MATFKTRRLSQGTESNGSLSDLVGHVSAENPHPQYLLVSQYGSSSSGGQVDLSGYLLKSTFTTFEQTDTSWKSSHLNSSSNPHTQYVLSSAYTTDITDINNAIIIINNWKTEHTSAVDPHPGKYEVHNAVYNHNIAADAHLNVISDAISLEADARNTAIETHNEAVTAHSDIRQLIIDEATARDLAISIAISSEVTNRNNAITTSINGEVTARNSAISAHDTSSTAHSAAFAKTTKYPDYTNPTDINAAYAGNANSHTFLTAGWVYVKCDIGFKFMINGGEVVSASSTAEACALIPVDVNDVGTGDGTMSQLIFYPNK